MPQSKRGPVGQGTSLPSLDAPSVGGNRRAPGKIVSLWAAGQRASEEAPRAVARKVHGLTGAQDQPFAGGTGLNRSADNRVMQRRE